ncbi:hypothetical protein VTP01DRAFT_3666 [Rhizomucor pusillus]|uniref:uncharacterized protein n=1 Tax=Rhizomucor pusillus TaxID=4840 RepID=UPI0037426D94
MIRRAAVATICASALCLLLNWHDHDICERFDLDQARDYCFHKALTGNTTQQQLQLKEKDFLFVFGGEGSSVWSC